MSRKEFTKATKLKALKRANGKCEGCGQPLKAGLFQFDHIKADGLDGDNSLENCKVLCSGGRASCHGIKTHEEDIPIMRKADAQRDAYQGTTRARKKIPQPPRAPRKPSKPSLPPKQFYKDAS